MKTQVVLFLLLTSACGAEPELTPAATPSPPPEIARPYDESVDAQAEIDRALERAATHNARVLLMFGGNWCVWCRRLDYVFQHEPRVSERLATSYELVHVDIGERDRNRDVSARYGDAIDHGLPCLVVLEPDGTVAHVQETGELEEGDHHDPDKLLAFLARFQR